MAPDGATVERGVWTDEVIEEGCRSRLVVEFPILVLADQGLLTGRAGVPCGSTGLIVDRPLVAPLLRLRKDERGRSAVAGGNEARLSPAGTPVAALPHPASPL